MTKKLFLLLMLILGVVITQSSVSADEQYQKDFFVNAIQQKIERNWIAPDKDTTISTIVTFDINTDGSISPVSILRSSEDENYDASVVKAVYKSVPFEYSSELKQPVSMEIFFSPYFMVANDVNNKSPFDKIVNVSNIKTPIDFSDYLENLQTKINSNWKPIAFSKERENIALIKIDKDGALSNPSVLEPSHDFRFDASTLDAIAKSVPMDAFPSRITAPTTNVQLDFHYKESKSKDGKKVTTHFVTASVLNIEGCDNYTKMVEKILKNNLKDNGTILERKLVFEAQINSVGKLKYVKILEPSCSKRFDRMVLGILEKSSFPQFSETINSDSITLKYELITGMLTGTRIFPRPE